jgi:hypothetical protein
MYYSTQPFLAWALNHYFYNRKHFVWSASPFYPYKTNPKSSNPYLIYADLYWPWREDDPYDKFITTMRLNLRSGVIAAAPSLTAGRVTALKRVCARAEVALFYPIVYRLDIRQLDPTRVDSSSGSAAVGSSEFLVKDLGETEFDVLFDAEHGDAGIEKLAEGNLSSSQALNLLQSRCK